MFQKLGHLCFPLILAFFLLPTEEAFAQGRGFGVGIFLSEEAGISFKKWQGSTTAFQAGIAWDFDHDFLLLHVDHIIHKFRVFKVRKGRLPLYLGFGGQALIGDDDRLGFRIPVGIAYLVSDVPLDIFFEVVPRLDLTPATDFDINLALGARYFF
jgi:hypothetical protein